MRHPCKKDCPRRSATCRSACPDWAKYEAAKAERYARRDREREVEAAYSDAVYRMERRKRNHR